MFPTSLPSMYHRMVGLGSAVSAFLGSQPTVIDSSLVSYTSFAVLMRGGDNLSAVTKKKFSGYQIFGINHRQTSQNEDLKYIIINFYHRNSINYNLYQRFIILYKTVREQNELMQTILRILSLFLL